MGDGGRGSHESGRGGRRARTQARLVAAKLVAAGLALPLLLLAACDGGTGPDDDDGSDPPDRVSFEFDFRDSGHDFEADFTDVPVEQADGVGFDAGHRPLPDPLSGGGLYQAGLNLSDDLFMFFRKRVEGLEPGRSYAVGFELEIASPIHEGCEVGTGTLVVVKAGASRERPERVVVHRNGRDEYRLSVDKGEQHQSGEAAVTLGDIRNGLPGCPHDGTWDREAVADDDQQITVTADEAGRAWLFFGTESAFEVSHELFFTRFGAEFELR